jgi:hypothetical protein
MAAAIVCCLIPIRIISEANQREHWRKSASRKALHRNTTRCIMQSHSRPWTDGPVTIKLSRIAPRVLDSDNLQSGFKACRDGVADWLGIDDGSPRLTWDYEQRKGKPGEYMAEVLVTWEA